MLRGDVEHLVPGRRAAPRRPPRASPAAAPRRHAVAVLAERPRDRQPDPARTTSHQRRLLRQPRPPLARLRAGTLSCRACACLHRACEPPSALACRRSPSLAVAAAATTMAPPESASRPGARRVRLPRSRRPAARAGALGRDRGGPVVAPAGARLHQGDATASPSASSPSPATRSPTPRSPSTPHRAAVKGPAIRAPSRRGREPRDRAAFTRRDHRRRSRRRQVVYVADVPLEKPGEWVFAALTRRRWLRRRPVADPQRGRPSRPVRTQATRAPVTTPTAADDARPRRRSTPASRPATMHDGRPRRRARQEAGGPPLRHPGALPEPRLRPGRRRRRAGQARPPAMTSPSSTWRSTTTTSPTRAAPPGRAYGLPDRALAVRDRQRTATITTRIEGAFSVAELQAAVDQVSSS